MSRSYSTESFVYWSGACFFAVLGAFTVAVSLLERGAIDWAWLTACALLTGVCVRGALSRLQVTADAVIVRNPFGQRKRIRWQDIASFKWGRYGIFPACLQVELKDGAVMPVWSVQRRNPMTVRSDARFERIVAELNDELERRKGKGIEDGQG